MKKLFKNTTLAMVIAFFFSMNNTAYASNVHSAANGNMSNSGSWVSSPPTNYDTVYIDHDITFSGTQNWASSTVNVVIITDSGSLSPSGTNASFRLPSGASLLTETGGEIVNNSGNNSNHEIRIGSTCVWGKKCCSGNTTISGPALVDASNPCSYTPLPVHLLSFTGKRIDAALVSIKWATASEEQNQKFIVEYSNDGKSFVPIGEVLSLASAGNSQTILNYEFIDNRIISKQENSFYRIKQIDLNGGVGLISNVIIVAGPVTDVILPAVISQSISDNSVCVYVNPDLGEISYTIEICNFYGQKIFSQISDKSGLQNLAELNLEQGMYVVYIHFADIDKTISQKILVR